MAPEIVTLRDDQTGSSAKVLVGFGFNCYSFTARVADEPIEVLWATPSFEAGTQRPSGSGIPVLFPFPGRLRGRQLHYHGQTYEIGNQEDRLGNAIHGYVFDRPWKVVDVQPQRVVGEFHAGSLAPGLLKKWPADFRLTMSYELRGNTLRSEITVSNPDDKPLPFGLGTHPYFRVPLGAGGVADECRIVVPAREYWVIDQMLPTGERLPADGELGIADGLPFARTSLDHVFGGLQASGEMVRTSIEDPHTGRKLTQTFDRSFAACVVYNPPHRQAICIEPYSCIPDTYALTSRGQDAGLRILAPGASHQATIEIRLE